MQLLRKTVNNSQDKRKDNADKKALLPRDLHPQTAAIYKTQWLFVQDETLRENIAYQMQYLEFLINLYNDYQVYLTVESLLCKDIIVAVGGVVEAALFDRIQSCRTQNGLDMNERADFTRLLGQAYHEYGLINKDLWHFFHTMRKTRNNIHLKAADFREHTAYSIDEANKCIHNLEIFRLELSQNK
jgi:hypothetical protein